MKPRLTAQQAIEIFKRSHNGDGNQSLANEFNISRRNVAKIKNGETWKHVTHHPPHTH